MSDPNEYWVNNPLITPVNKAMMYDNDIDGAVSRERERIIKLLEDNDHLSHICADRFIALIKEDSK